MTLGNRNEMKVKIDDLQREYRSLEDGKLLVVLEAAISARKQSIRSEIDSMEFFLRVSGSDAPTTSNVQLWNPRATSSPSP
jgi:hypothetical protein